MKSYNVEKIFQLDILQQECVCSSDGTPISVIGMENLSILFSTDIISEKEARKIINQSGRKYLQDDRLLVLSEKQIKQLQQLLKSVCVE